MRLALAALIATGMVGPSHAFDFDRPYRDVLKHFGGITIGDLTVGDTAWLGFGAMCLEDSRLHIPAATDVEKPEDWFDYSVTREAGGTLRLEVKTQGRAHSLVWREFAQTAWRSCGAMVEEYYPGSELIPVTTVNGLSAISEAMTKD